LPKAVDSETGDGRQRLLRTAFKLFGERGFDSVTVRELAAASQVSIGLIKHHFGSKEGLRAAVDDAFMAQFEEALTLAPRPGGGAGLTTEDLAVNIDAWIGRHQADWADTVNYFRRALLEESDWGYALFSRFYGIVQRTIAGMEAAGQIAPEVDRLWLPFLMIYLEVGTILLDPYIRRTLGESGFDGPLWRRRHRAYMSLIGRGVAPRSPRPATGDA
jgi:AcrR family transcriptional regulator